MKIQLTSCRTPLIKIENLALADWQGGLEVASKVESIN